ncbi:MAG: TolC family protein [bacterium]|nr:TolC family protein [bacterium]
MKKIYFFVIILTFFIFNINTLLFAAILGYTNDKNLNLDASINLALLNNRNLLIANEEVMMVKYKTAEALSFKAMQIDFSAGYNHYNLEDDYYILDDGVNTYLFNKNAKNQHSLSLSMSQIIYNGSRTRNTKKATEATLKKAKSEYETIKQQVVYRTKVYFYRYMFLNKKLKFLEDIKKYLETLNASQYKISFDFDRFYKNFMFAYDETIIAHKITRLEFFNLMGIEQDSLIILAGKLEAVHPLNIDLDSAIAKALYSRPELMSSEASEELGFLEMNISMAERNPVIALGGGYQYTAPDFRMKGDNWQENWYCGLTMNIPLFDGGAWIARNNQTKINLRKLKLKRADIEEDIKLSIKNAFMGYEHQRRKLTYESNYYQTLLENHYKKFLEKNLIPSTNNTSQIKITSTNNWRKTFNLIRKYKEDTINYLETINAYNEKTLYLYYVIGEID